MSPGLVESNKRVLIIDDNPAIHADFRKILDTRGAAAAELARATSELFGDGFVLSPKAEFDLTTALQGEDGLSSVREAVRSGKPYAMAFVDVRMPPGWDGIETTTRIWEMDPDIQIVLCTAYSDYSWDEIASRLGSTDRLVILKKPFDAVEVLQLASALTEKWALLQRVKGEFQNLEHMVGDRTRELKKANLHLQKEIAEHQRAEQMLQATQEKLNHFLSKSPAVLYSYKWENGQFVPAWVSDNFATLAGGEPQDWYAQAPTLDYVEETDRPAVNAGLKALLNRGALTLEYRVVRKDGTLRWIRDDRKLLRDGGGQPVEIIGCWTDITEHRLLQEELRQAQKMESVGQLAGGVAHDFNNLLMVIQGYIEMLLNTEQFQSPVVESLHQVYSAAEKAGHLTRQLLAFSRKQMMQPQELNLNELVETVTKLLGRTLGEHIKVKSHCAAPLPPVFADRGMIDQVIMNLAVNSRDAMPNGGNLTFSTSLQTIGEGQKRQRPDARPGRFVCLSVADNGGGIAPEHVPHLFEPFFTTKEVGKGTGLGLATVYGIVKQHEGWIEVESQMGHGTTFRIFLPAVAATTGQPDESAAAPDVRGGRETILLVEDEPAVRSLVRTSLQRYGYQVRTAASGADALKEWTEHLNDIDLLITDVVMPDGVSGWELAKKFQAKKPRLKTVYMSGYNANMTVMEAGPVIGPGSLFLQKPFRPQKLAEVVRACLEGAAPTAEPAAADR
jgi:two-component system, cell cycle sensor histidine kinase and response regulator CckA